jgi:DNA invertase Pin-like site-specific DNA recombinase
MRPVELPESVTSRRAVIYVRQSSMTQVQDHLESQRRQYDLSALATEYGFREVVTIDEDLGRSASGRVARPGFEALVAQLCQGVVGAVFCLEASRLARNGREWHHLLELCGLVGARVIDSDGVYDPGMPNDRLLLGLKGTMSEFELTLMRRRLVEGAQAKAKRGEFRIPVPIGYLWSRETGLEMDPDRRVQEAIRTVFHGFERLESARQVHKHLCREGVLFPRPVDAKRQRPLRWILPAYRNVISLLQNPFYAGAYAYGKTTHRTALVAGRLSKSYGHGRPMSDWAVLLRGHHAGYIGWDAFERNQERLRRNAYRKPAGGPKSGRGGRALLAGLLRCRRCGRMLTVLYTGQRPGHPRYVCRAGYEMHGTTAPCIAFGAARIDDGIARELLRAVEPLAVEAAIAAMDLAHDQTMERRRALALECQQAEYEVQLARRRYEAVDPDNRLVAAELEVRWNTALERLRTSEARLRETEAVPETVPDREALFRLAGDLQAAWDAPTHDPGVQQRLVRALVEEIVADVDDTTREIVLVIHWRGGQHSELRARKPASGEHRKRAPAEAEALIREMAGTWSDEHVAATLNRMGLRTGQGLTWSKRRVESFRKSHEISAHAAARKDGAWLTLRDAAKTLGVTNHVIYRLIESGALPAKQVMPDAPWQIRTEDLQTPAVKHALANRRSIQRPCRVPRDDRTLTIPGT